MGFFKSPPFGPVGLSDGISGLFGKSGDGFVGASGTGLDGLLGAESGFVLILILIN